MRGETDRMALQQYKVFVWRYDTTIFKFDSGRLGRVEIVTLTVGARTKEGKGGGGG